MELTQKRLLTLLDQIPLIVIRTRRMTMIIMMMTSILGNTKETNVKMANAKSMMNLDHLAPAAPVLTHM
jgi:hypothetical protein